MGRCLWRIVGDFGFFWRLVEPGHRYRGFVADGRIVMDSLCHRHGVREYSGRSFALDVQASAGCQRLESIIARAWRFS